MGSYSTLFGTDMTKLVGFELYEAGDRENLYARIYNVRWMVEHLVHDHVLQFLGRREDRLGM